jgi:hypothetical protein
MDSSVRQSWFGVVLLGVVYFVIGIGFGELAKWAASAHARFIWNLSSFLTSVIVFALHITYEYFRLHNAPRTVATRVALAVALGAFALGVAANIHGLRVGSSSTQQRLLAFALVIWPAMTGIPAFVVALIASAGLKLARRNI